MVLTAVQIKTILDALTFPETVRVYDFVNADERRKYPSIDIDNVGSEIKKANETETDKQQRFLIHLYYKIRGSGSNDNARVKSIEDVIMAGLDAATLAGSNIFTEEKGWNRPTDKSPIHRIHSTLTVFVNDIISTTGTGLIGANMTMELNSAALTLTLLAKPLDDYSITTDEDLDDTGLEVVTGMAHTSSGIKSVEFESTIALQTSLRNLIKAKGVIDVVIKDGVVARPTQNVILTNVSTPVQYDQVERAVLTMRLTS